MSGASSTCGSTFGGCGTAGDLVWSTAAAQPPAPHAAVGGRGGRSDGGGDGGSGDGGGSPLVHTSTDVVDLLGQRVEPAPGKLDDTLLRMRVLGAASCSSARAGTCSLKREALNEDELGTCWRDGASEEGRCVVSVVGRYHQGWRLVHGSLRPNPDVLGAPFLLRMFVYTGSHYGLCWTRGGSSSLDACSFSALAYCLWCGGPTRSQRKYTVYMHSSPVVASLSCSSPLLGGAARGLRSVVALPALVRRS